MFYSSEFEADDISTNHNNSRDGFVAYNDDWVEEQTLENNNSSSYESPSVWNRSQLNDLPDSHFQHTREDNPLVSDICSRFDALRSDLTRVHPNKKPVTSESPFEALNLYTSGNGDNGSSARGYVNEDNHDEDGYYYVKYGGHLSGHEPRRHLNNNETENDAAAETFYAGYANSDLDSDTLSAIHPGESIDYTIPNYNSPNPVVNNQQGNSITSSHLSSSTSAVASTLSAANHHENMNINQFSSSYSSPYSSANTQQQRQQFSSNANNTTSSTSSGSMMPKKRNPAYYGKVKLQSRLTSTRFTEEMPEIEDGSLSYTLSNNNRNNNKMQITPKRLSIPPDSTHLFFQDPLPYSNKHTHQQKQQQHDTLLQYVAPAAEKSGYNKIPRASLISRQSSVSSSINGIFPKADRVVKKLGLASSSSSSSFSKSSSLTNFDHFSGTGGGNARGLKSKNLRFKVPVEVEELHAIKKKYQLTRRNATLNL